MKLSTKARYAVTAMMDLALHEKHPVTLADISHYQGISLSYLEQLFAKLRKHGLVNGVRGPGGGYRLARPSREISVAEVVSAINGTEEKIFKGDGQGDVASDRDALEVMWGDLSDKLYGFLNGITLDQFVHVANARGGSEAQGGRSEAA